MATKDDEYKLENAARTRKGRNTKTAAKPINISGYNRNIPKENLAGRNKAANVELASAPATQGPSAQSAGASQAENPAIQQPTAAQLNESTLPPDQRKYVDITPEQQAVRNANVGIRAQQRNAALDATEARRAELAPQREAQGLAAAQNYASPVDVIRGTQQEQVAPGNGDYVAYTGQNDAEGRALSQADSIRRNVFSTPGESDAMAIAKRAGADRAADNYLNTTVGADVDRERTSSGEKVGLANVGARYAGIDAQERIAQAGNRSNERVADMKMSGAPDYANMLEQGNAQQNLLMQQQRFAEIDAMKIPEAERQRLKFEWINQDGSIYPLAGTVSGTTSGF